MASSTSGMSDIDFSMYNGVVNEECDSGRYNQCVLHEKCPIVDVKLSEDEENVGSFSQRSGIVGDQSERVETVNDYITHSLQEQLLFEERVEVAGDIAQQYFLGNVYKQPSPSSDDIESIISGLRKQHGPSPLPSECHNDGSDSRTTYSFRTDITSNGSLTKPPLCTEHKELSNHFCTTCHLAICGTCMKLNHNVDEGHRAESLSATRRQQKEDLKKVVNDMDSEVFKCEQSVRELTIVKQQIQMSLALQEGNIDRHVEMAIAKIKKEAIILRFILREKEQLRIEKINREIKRLRELSDEISTLKIATQKTVSCMKKYEYLESHDKLIKCMKSKLGRDTTGPVSRNSNIGMSKCPLDIPFTLEVNTSDLVQVNRCSLDLVQEFGDQKGLCDITSTSSGALVVCDRHANHLLVYKQNKNGLYKKHCTSAVSTKNSNKGSYGIAVDNDDKLLVARSDLIEMYSESGKYVGMLSITDPVTEKECTIADNTHIGAYAIKVMSQSDIVVSDREKSTISRLDPTGKILSRIDTTIIPRRLAVLPHNHVAVSDWKHGKVAVINMDSGETVNMFDVPSAKGLCYHNESDCILVGRYLKVAEDGTPLAGSGVVEQYCSMSGRLVASIAKGLCCPQNFTVTKDGCLAVADYKTIKVYKIK